MSGHTEAITPLEPHIAPSSVNGSLMLWEGTTTTDWGQGPENCHAALFYSWRDGAVVFELTYPHRTVTFGTVREIVGDDGLRFKGWWRGSYGVPTGTLIKGFAWDIHQHGDDEPELIAIQFLLPNMLDDFSTQHVTIEPSKKTLKRITLEADEWRVTVDGMGDPSVLYKELNATRGWAVTHIGRIESTSGKTFKAKTVRNVLKGLQFFFSFVRGQWVAPLLPAGYDEAGNRTWTELRPAKIHWWDYGATWQREVGQLAKSAFPGFFRLFCRSDRRGSLMLAVDWFLQSNSQDRGVDASLVSALTGLDLMAWNLIVDDRQLISNEGFDRLQTRDRIRLLLKVIGFEIQIPIEYQDLQSFAKSILLPDLLALIRNSLVHPTLKNRERVSALTNSGKRQAWLLAMRILELSILFWWDCDPDSINFAWRDWQAAPWYSD